MITNMNWKSLGATITSALSIIALVPYDLYQGSLKTFAEMVPGSWKAPIVLGGLFATIVLRIWNAATQQQPK